ncbi:hypothetical protein ACEPAG_7852 [Sanghuangporus baumii]
MPTISPGRPEATVAIVDGTEAEGCGDCVMTKVIGIRGRDGAAMNVEEGIGHLIFAQLSNQDQAGSGRRKKTDSHCTACVFTIRSRG